MEGPGGNMAQFLRVSQRQLSRMPAHTGILGEYGGMQRWVVGSYELRIGPHDDT